MPRYSSAKGGFVRGNAEAPTASAARTATGNSGAIDASDIRQVSLLVDVTAVSGTTPSMTPSIEQSDDGSTWTQVVAGSAMNSISAQRLRASIQADFYRIVWTISGTTPSFTFSVTGTSK